MKKIYGILILLVSFVFLIGIDAHASTNNEIDELNSANTFDYNSSTFLIDNEGTSINNNPHYDLSARNDNVVGDDVLLTIFTPGLGGDSSHWSNGLDNEENIEKNTLVSSIIKKNGNCIIKKLHMNGATIEEPDDTTSSNVEEINNDSSILKHTILFFETEQSLYSNDYVYSQFDYAVSSVVNEIAHLNGNRLPKINLIGHSRGGLINLLYAMDHPDLINQIFSIGTPYCGSTTASLDVQYLNSKIGSGDTDEDDEKDGEDDIVDETLFTSYKNRWNNNISLYSGIDVHAFGGMMSYSFIEKLLTDIPTAEFLCQVIFSSTNMALVAPLEAVMLDVSANLAYIDIKSVLYYTNIQIYNAIVSALLPLFPKIPNDYVQFIPELASAFDTSKFSLYDKIILDIEISLREIDNGYQYIFLFSSSAKSNDYLLDSSEISYGSSSYGTRIIRLECYVSDLIDNNLYIRFGASGTFDDDWKTNYRIYNIEFVREA